MTDMDLIRQDGGLCAAGFFRRGRIDSCMMNAQFGMVPRLRHWISICQRPPTMYIPWLGLGNKFYLGFDTSGTANTSGANTAITNTGSAIAYPTIIIKRSGGTTVLPGEHPEPDYRRQAYFNYALADGEEIVINCTPATKTITSTFIGNAIGKLCPTSTLPRSG